MHGMAWHAAFTFSHTGSRCPGSTVHRITLSVHCSLSTFRARLIKTQWNRPKRGPFPRNRPKRGLFPLLNEAACACMCEKIGQMIFPKWVPRGLPLCSETHLGVRIRNDLQPRLRNISMSFLVIMNVFTQAEFDPMFPECMPRRRPLSSESNRGVRSSNDLTIS